MPITFIVTEHEADTRLSIAGSLDAMTAPELSPTIERLVEERRPRIIIDIAGLELIDSSGVAAIVALYKRTRAHGGKVSVRGARDQPLAIFRLLRMDRVFDLSAG